MVIARWLGAGLAGLSLGCANILGFDEGTLGNPNPPAATGAGGSGPTTVTGTGGGAAGSTAAGTGGQGCVFKACSSSQMPEPLVQVTQPSAVAVGGQYLYWSDGDRVLRAYLGGGPCEDSQWTDSQISSIAFEPSTLYLAAAGVPQLAYLSGWGTPGSVSSIGPYTDVWGVAANSAMVFLRETDNVTSFNIVEYAFNSVCASTGTFPAIAADEANVYVAEGADFVECPAYSGAKTTIGTSPDNIVAATLDQGELFWTTNQGGLFRGALVGFAPQPIMIAANLAGVAVEGSCVYYADLDQHAIMGIARPSP